MKTSHLIPALVLVTSFTSLSFAGPGIDYWNRMTQAAKDRAALETKAALRAKDVVQAKAAPTVASCAACGCPGMKKT